MKIDLHNHTTLASSCSVLDIKDLIRRAKELKLDGVCVTEHNTFKTSNIAEEIGKEMNFLVIAGMEVTTNIGDILTFGIEEENLFNIPIIELISLKNLTNGVLIPVHPFRKNAFSIGNYIYDYYNEFDGIEILNGNSTESENNKAKYIAEFLNLKTTGGSDAHSIHQVGRYYTFFDTDFIINDRKSLIKAIKNKKFRALENNLYGKI